MKNNSLFFDTRTRGKLLDLLSSSYIDRGMVGFTYAHSEDLISEVILWPSWIYFLKVSVGNFILKIGMLAGICFSLYTFIQFYINISSF